MRNLRRDKSSGSWEKSKYCAGVSESSTVRSSARPCSTNSSSLLEEVVLDVGARRLMKPVSELRIPGLNSRLSSSKAFSVFDRCLEILLESGESVVVSVRPLGTLEGSLSSDPSFIECDRRYEGLETVRIISFSSSGSGESVNLTLDGVAGLDEDSDELEGASSIRIDFVRCLIRNSWPLLLSETSELLDSRRSSRDDESEAKDRSGGADTAPDG
ncbi:hypothetical protein OGATHE_000049 [Ogataea polymorpha]|uniref:Uncharacterized protein n=1 Tax=Ogataea polymorpha TaxID=460523 RepID=A0A9P8PWD2_9ASCO|nr:hypothetical protein OGATHE_000049 [Ogataea polymorpha]